MANNSILHELARAKAAFQLRAIEAVICAPAHGSKHDQNMQETPMTAPDTDTLAGLRDELRLIGCHQNGDARCTCSIGADAVDAIDALRAQAAKDKARIERLGAALREIARQKRTDELETEYDVEFADFEGGYDACIDRARAALEEGEMTTDPKNPLPPRLDPTCTCICHTQPGVMHVAPCCREADPRDAEIARLRMALAEVRKETVRLNKATDKQYVQTLEKLKAERDAAIAGAYEAAASLAVNGMGLVQERQDAIRALTPADALAARDRRDAQMRAEGRKEGLREAADICWNKRDLLADAERKQVDVGLTGRDYYGRRLEAELLSRSLRALAAAEKGE